MGRRINESEFVGHKYGMLTVTGFIERKCGHIIVSAVCDCGNTKERVSLNSMKAGDTFSCGCYRDKSLRDMCKTHGLSDHPLHNTWCGMISRCTNPGNAHYKNYGGRGITICNEWVDSFSSFYNWAINNGWDFNLKIDRINNDGNYCPENCRFVTRRENQNNRRNTIFVTHNGITKPLTHWAEEYNINRSVLRLRICNGWNIEDALTCPIMSGRPKLPHKNVSPSSSN